MKHRETPLPLIQKWTGAYPSAWERMDKCYDAKAEMQWPDYCHVPIGAAHTVLSLAGMDKCQCAEYCAELTAAYIWRKNKVVYQFDADLAWTLAEQAVDVEDTDCLPVDLLMHLPYPCIYVKCTGLIDKELDGFFAWIEHDVNRDQPEMRIQYVLRGMRDSIPAVLHLVTGGTIKDCIDSTNAEVAKYTAGSPDLQAEGADDIRMILVAIQLVLYLISDRADVQDDEQPKTTNPRLRRKSTDKASFVRGKQVGVNVGRFIRSSNRADSHAPAEGTGTAKRPHSRRGHWHHYWTGARGSEERRLVLKWTAPTFIHSSDGTIAVYDVKGESKR